MYIWKHACHLRSTINVIAFSRLHSDTAEFTYNDSRYNNLLVIMTTSQCIYDFLTLPMETASRYNDCLLNCRTAATNALNPVMVKRGHTQNAKARKLDQTGHTVVRTPLQSNRSNDCLAWISEVAKKVACGHAFSTHASRVEVRSSSFQSLRLRPTRMLGVRVQNTVMSHW